jgi:hypothetical protein
MWLAVLSLMVGMMSLGVVAPASAEGLPSIRLISPSLTVGTNASDYTTDLPSNDYSAGSKSYQTFMQDTETVSLTYFVTTDGTTPAAGAVVKLLGNSPWSASNATWTLDGNAVIPTALSWPDAANPGGSATATTDEFGMVTFTLINTNTTGFEPAPADYAVGRAGITSRLYGTFKPVLVVEGADTPDLGRDIDLVTFDVYQAAPPCYNTNVATINFEDCEGLPAPISFGGNSNAVVPDPAVDAGDNKVLKITRNSSGFEWQGTTVLDLGGPTYSLISETSTAVTLRVYSPLPNSPILLKLETTDASDNISIERYETTTATTDDWQTLTYDFTGADLTRMWKMVSIFVDGKVVPIVTADFFIDDISFPGAAYTLVPVAHRLDVAGSTGLLGTPFDKGYKEWFQYYSSGVKYYTAIAEVGTAVTLKWLVTDTFGAPFANQPVNLIVGKSYSKSTATFSTTYSGATSFSTIGSTGASDAKTISGTTDANGYVSWTLTNTNSVGEDRPTNLNGDVEDGGVFAQIALLLPGGTQNDEDQDIIDLHFVAAVGGGGGGGGDNTPSITFPITMDFDTGDAMTTLYSQTRVEFGGAFDSINSTSIGGNTTSKLKITRGSTTEPTEVYAGAVVFTLPAGQLISTNSTTVSLDVYSPKAGAAVRLKLEGAGGAFVEVEQSVTSANTWQTLTFDFSKPTVGDLKPNFTYKTAVVMPDFGAVGGGEVFYVDNISFPGSVLASTPNMIIEVAVPGPAIKDNPKYFEPTVKPEAKVIPTAGTFTCNNTSASVAPTLAVYYLLVDRMPVAGVRYGKFEGVKPLYPFINALADGSATATSATFALDKAWNANGHTARLQCVIQTGGSVNTEILKTPVVQLKGVGKHKKFVPFKAAKPSKVTMRLVEPVLKKDAAGKPVDYVDMSASPIKDDNWGKYYGNSDGGLGVYYKYLNAGSTTTFKYKVTDSVTKQAVPYYKVWLVVNKNYGGAELVSFTHENNGIISEIAPNLGPIGETQIEGRTDINGYVSFTLVNTNTAAQAEPKPAALNAEQPKTMRSIYFSTITLTARLGVDETKETKDFVWAHIVQP